jgi:hypothetical protein
LTTEDRIAELLAQAEPLRALPDDEAEANGLPALVDEINRLRNGGEPVKRGPGRPKKAD